MKAKDFYIFLDVDGVFNSFSWKYYVRDNKLDEKGFNEEFNPANLNVFNKILKTLRENNFNPKIVLSSDWRIERMQEVIDLFNKYKIDYNGTYDKTGNAFIDPYKLGFKRASEIVNYMVTNKISSADAFMPKHHFIIIDDYTSEINRYMNISPAFFLQTSGEDDSGLNDKDFNKFKENNLPKIIQLLGETEHTF